MPSCLVRSPHVQVIPSRQGYTCYHSLFGNLRALDREAVGILDLFAVPRPPEDVLPHHGPEAWQTLQELRRLSYLVEESCNERERVHEWLRRRAELVPTGYYLCEVELSVSDICDFDCPYCFADNADRRSQTRREMAGRGDRMMSPDRAQHILERLVELQKVNGRNRLLVKFIGKEPLLNPQTVAFILDHFQNGEPYGVDIVYHMTTNCTRVPDELAGKMAQRRMVVNASIDMPGEAGELTRRKKGGGRVFDIVDGSIRTMRRHGVEVRLNSVLGRQNYQDHGLSLVDYAKSHGITTIALFLVVCDEELAAHRALSTDEIADYLFRLWSYGREQGVRLRGYWYNPVAKLVATRNIEFEDQLFYKNSCAGCGNQVNIEPSGEIYSCRMSAPLLGHIDELDKLLHSDLYRHYVMRIYADDCRGCPLEGPCGGLCAGHLEAKTGDIYRMDPVHCDIYRKVCRKILEVL
ncbi:MAG: SPASM domain-containing protein [Acetobacteraceae bacterium]|nr:SPASM domain-containing protein [Acetobacteraceae bacterium]